MSDTLPTESLDAIARDLSDPGEWEEPVPINAATNLLSFPTRALPRWLAEYVTALAVSTQTPPDLAGLLSLGILSACVGGRVGLDVRPGWSETSNLYVAIAMESGENKSAVLREMTAPLHDLEAELVEQARPTIAEACARKDIADATAAVAKATASKAKAGDRQQLEAEAVDAAIRADNAVVPASPRLLVDDVTPERLAGLLAEQEGRLAMFSAEGGVFGMMAGRYDQGGKGRAGPNLDVWLKAHDGERMAVDRVGRPSSDVEHPCLTIGLAVQPDVLRGLAAVPGFKGRGLLGRFLYALPVSRMGYRDLSPPPVPPAVQDDYRLDVLTLARTLAAVPNQPVELTFSEAAVAALTDYRRTIEPRLRPSGDLRSMSEWAGKLHGSVARIAGLLHLAEHVRGGWVSAVTVDTMARAIEVGRYLLAHAQAAHDLIGTDADLDRARFALDWIREREMLTVTRRALMVGTSRSRFPDKDTAASALDRLAGLGWLRPTTARPTGGRGIAGPVYEVNPAVHATQATEATHRTAEGSCVASVASVALNSGIHDLPLGRVESCRGCHGATVTEDEQGPVHPHCAGAA